MTDVNGSAEPTSAGTFGAVFVASFALLSLEIAQVRVFSYAIDPLLVFSAISVALLGVGAGGIAISLRPQLAKGDVRARLASLLGAFSISTIVGHAVFARTSQLIGWGTSAGVFFASLPTLSLLVAPYFFAGALLAIAIARHVNDVGRVYFANLVGSALGCVVLVPLLRPVGVEILLAGIAVLAGVGGVALALAPATHAVPRGTRVFTVACALLSVACLPMARRLFAFQPDPSDLYGMARDALAKRFPGRDAKTYEPVREYARWDPVSRVEVYSFAGDFGVINDVAPMRLFVQDGGAGSLLVDLHADETTRNAFLESTIWSGAYLARTAPASQVLIIGLGGAPDVLTAVHHHAAHVTGIEINGSAIDLVQGPYASFLGDPYAWPEVDIHHLDGRSFLERSPERWDVIQMTGADTYSAAAAGAFVFSESYLYTLEAFERYMSTLSDDGVLSITRFGPEALRVITSEMAAMQALGISEPEQHLVVLRQGIANDVLFLRRAVTREDSAAIVARVAASQQEHPRIRIPVYEAMGFGISTPIAVDYAPFFPAHSSVARLVQGYATGHEAAVLATIPIDLSPVSDDRPFFFQFLGVQNIGRLLRAGEDDYFARGLRAHLVFLVAIAVMASVATLVPLVRRRVRGGGALRVALYFGALGLGYLFVELTLMQKSALFLGHPTNSIATTLLSLLLSSAFGSAWASRVVDRGVAPERVARLGALAAVVALVLTQCVLHRLFLALLPWPLPARVAVLAIAVAPLGLAMGMPFPMGLRCLQRRGDAAIAWALGINGFTSVVASLLAVPLAMWGGFSSVVAVAAALYALAAVVRPVSAA
jgi:hypothetical protein